MEIFIIIASLAAVIAATVAVTLYFTLKRFDKVTKIQKSEPTTLLGVVHPRDMKSHD